MIITHFYKETSKQVQYMNYDVTHVKGDIFDAYNNPSQSKIYAFNSIRDDYTHNDTSVMGIPCKTVIVPASLKKLNNKMYLRYIAGTLNVVGASSHFFSTIAVFEDVETEKRYLVKETHCNTYMCELLGGDANA